MSVLFFVIGTVLGSFYLVIATRLPLNEDIIVSRSKCDNCHHILKWYDLIPIFSYLFCLGKCRYCKQKINPLNFIIEVVTGSLFLFGYLHYGLNYQLFIFLILISTTIIIFISDLKYMIILDSSIIIPSVLILLINCFIKGFNFMLLSILMGICLLIVLFIIKKIGDKLFKRESLGGGDIKLAFLIGITLGFKLGLIALVFASFLALPYAIAQTYLIKKNELPYGPFLIGATCIIYLFLEKFSNLLIFFTLP